ncbi:bifunctional lysylphosphatidylglycerol flippase/synthetase MprF [Azomonas macrocytogenes]|uniref:Phosphatidylglycerol lysyltransferase n=1 Tax=Azomonas macrocytogenes TaxID=69962 RepID=A0A839T6T0_AZOMA|nr:bifunctional lysylphosphatidylglycerol flippase/synthetase MprF [Azomonas macrocytogenes]MBB3103383.1 phosphatidylglycerol lysyltransferase [Azomonas macrocytogenes]
MSIPPTISSSSASPQPSLFQRLHNHRRLIGMVAIFVVFGLALVACFHLLHEIDLPALLDALTSVSGWALLGAVLMTVIGFVAMLGYEWSACRYAGVSLPWKVLMAGGFGAFAIGNAVGLAMLSGGAVRLRSYSRHGLGTGEVMRISLFASLSLGCVLPLLAALAALSDLSGTALVLHLPQTLIATVASLLLAGYALLVFALRRWCQPEQPASACVLCKIGSLNVRLPGLRLTALQLLITVIDVAAAAAVLYLLLPANPPFGVFLLVYLLALVAGVLSHVPGGVGVFEAVLLAAFANELGTAALAAALLLYRLIYTLLPLLIACLMLLFAEARRLLSARQAVELASGMAAPILSLLVFLAGVVLLFSGVTPSIDSRLQALSFLVPQPLIEASHFIASLVGVFCLVLANGLWRRLSAAWALTIVLLLVGATMSLLKGFDWEEAIVTMVIAALLALFRPAFYRPSRLMVQPLAPLYLLASSCVVATSIWLLLFAYQSVPYSNQLWWQFELDGDAPRGLRAALGSALLLAVLMLSWLLRARPPVIPVPCTQALDKAAAIVRQSCQPDGGLALSGDKALLFDPAGQAFLMYARQGRSMIALFDPIGPSQVRAELVWQFRDLCDLHHARPVFYQVRPENLPLYMDIGLIAVKLGEEARVDLRSFELENKGKEMKDLRYIRSRGLRDGLQLEFHEPGQAPLEELQVISDAWLIGKQVREKGFSLGRFTPDYLNRFRIAVVRFQGRAVAFANLLETDMAELASLDLMRVHPQAPKLTMEFLMLGLILHFKSRDYTQFSLGMVPLSGLQPRRGAPLSQRLGALVFQRGEQFYNFQGLRRFKEKFQPYWEPRYLAVPAGLDPLVAMADTAALIAGGLTGLVKR